MRTFLDSVHTASTHGTRSKSASLLARWVKPWACMTARVQATPCHGRPCQEGPYLVIPATPSKSESALARLGSPWMRIAAMINASLCKRPVC